MTVSTRLARCPELGCHTGALQDPASAHRGASGIFQIGQARGDPDRRVHDHVMRPALCYFLCDFWTITATTRRTARPAKTMV
jgi:hypothetical protein